ncbi:MAG: low molecular weight phosphatase family protein [Bryobacteraceae bacterium]|nr:low molecular weight phosphatase family protein [Bryobacteraceae bacterium]
MAEAMARKYGSDVLIPSSAGTSAATQTHPTTRAVLREKNIDLGDHIPQRFSAVKPQYYDLIVNMSGRALQGTGDTLVETWDVADPMGQDEDFFRSTRDQIEMLVMRLILRIRTGKFDPPIDSKAASPQQ